jgi:hypothetical protein
MGDQFEHLDSFGSSIQTPLDPASSDEDFEDHSRLPSTLKVSSRVIDTSSLALSDNFVQTQHMPCFLLAPLPPHVKESQIFESCQKSQVPVKNVQIVDLNSKLGKAAFLWFNFEDEAKKEFFRFERAEISKDDTFDLVRTIKWVDYRVFDKDVKFYAVIVRGFSKALKPKELNRLFCVRFQRCEIRVVDGVACGVFVFQCASDVCAICVRYDRRRDSFGNFIKVTLHPLTLVKHSREIFDVITKGADDISQKHEKDSLEILKAITQGQYNQRDYSLFPSISKLKRYSDSPSEPLSKKSKSSN